MIAIEATMNTKNIIILFAIVMSGCSQVNQALGLDDENIFEEVLEDVVNTKTGVDIDFTGESKED